MADETPDFPIRTLIRPHPRHSEAVQQEAASGDTRYVIGKRQQTRDAFLKALRPGDVVEVYYLFLLAEPQGRATYNDLHDTLSQLDASGVRFIWESGTGRSSECPRMRELMVRVATDMIRSGGRRPRYDWTPLPMGRRPKMTPAQREIAERAWWDRRFRTKQQVQDYLSTEHRIEISHNRLFKLFGRRN
jgi:hypothetical protein